MTEQLSECKLCAVKMSHLWSQDKTPPIRASASGKVLSRCDVCPHSAAVC